jgi:hypothetical protein
MHDDFGKAELGEIWRLMLCATLFGSSPRKRGPSFLTTNLTNLTNDSA